MLADPHVEKAVQTIVDCLEADRDTVRIQAAVTLLELAETGGEGLGDGDGGGQQTKVVLIKGGAGSELERRMDERRAAARAGRGE